jgi:hypothetical protein
MFHWDGKSWTPVDPGTSDFRSIWGSGPADVWAVGTGGTVTHWDGGRWSKEKLPGEDLSLDKVGGRGEKDVWVVDNRDGALLHWDGTSWSRLKHGTPLFSQAIWSARDNDVWVGGFDSTPPPEPAGRSGFRCGTGNDLRTEEEAPPPVSSTLPPPDKVTNLVHWDGTNWSRVPSGLAGTVSGFWGSAPDDIWAVGDQGVSHWNGRAWGRVETGTGLGLSRVWGSSATDVWAVGDRGTILHWDGHHWFPSVSGTTESLTDVWGAQANDVWAVAPTGAMLHWNGATWAVVASAAPDFQSVWSSGPGDVWIAGTRVRYGHGSYWDRRGIVMHWDGKDLTEVASTGNERGRTGGRWIWGNAANDVWATGGSAVRWDGHSWKSFPAPLPRMDTEVLRSSGPNDVWITDASFLSHWNGSQWSLSRLGPEMLDVNAIWTNGPGDAWAVGSNARTDKLGGLIAHWDGKTWTITQATSTSSSLSTVCGRNDHDVWAIGWVNLPQDRRQPWNIRHQGVALHWNGSDWINTPVPDQLGSRDAWCSKTGEVWTVGGNVISHWDGKEWTSSTSERNLTGISGSETGDVWAVGTGGTLLHYHRDVAGPQH